MQFLLEKLEDITVLVLLFYFKEAT